MPATRRRRQRKRKSLRQRGGGIRPNISSSEQAELRAVLAYERNAYTRNQFLLGNTRTVRDRIAELISRQQPLTEPLVVWRGQHTHSIEPTSWFSVSPFQWIALEYGGKALFKIHLEPGVRYLDMYTYYADMGIQNPHTEAEAVRNFLQNPELNMSHNYIQFGEILVEGGGTFWKNAAHTKPGFRTIGKTRSRVPPDDLPPPVNGQTTIFLKETDYPMIPVYETYYVGVGCDPSAGRSCSIV